jgi:membrane protease subunit HflC
MKKHMGMILLAGFIVLALLVGTVTYQVDELQDVVLIKTFGEIKTVRDPRQDPGAAGLHLKMPWPVQRVVRYDARNFVFEDPYGQIETADKQNLLVSTYCAWRIADPSRFNRTLGTEEKGRIRVREKVRAAKGNVLGNTYMAQLINTDPEEMDLTQIEDEIVRQVQAELETTYGVQIVQVRIKLLGLPETVSEKVIEAQREERQRYVQDFRAQGEAQAKAIVERAKGAAAEVMAFAQRKAADIRTEGRRAAAKYYEQFEENEELSIFLRTLESLKKELAGRATIVLDGSRIPAIKWFRTGPDVDDLPIVPTQEDAEEAADDGDEPTVTAKDGDNG